MPTLSDVQAVEAHLRAGFDRCRIFTENEFPEPPKDGGAWLLLQFPWSRSEWSTIADADEECEHLEEGAFRFVLSVDRGDGAHVARAWLDEIAALFRGREIGGLQCFSPSSPVTDDRSETGDWFTVSIAVPYECVITEEA